MRWVRNGNDANVSAALKILGEHLKRLATTCTRENLAPLHRQSDTCFSGRLPKASPFKLNLQLEENCHLVNQLGPQHPLTNYKSLGVLVWLLNI